MESESEPDRAWCILPHPRVTAAGTDLASAEPETCHKSCSHPPSRATASLPQLYSPCVRAMAFEFTLVSVRSLDFVWEVSGLRL